MRASRPGTQRTHRTQHSKQPAAPVRTREAKPAKAGWSPTAPSKKSAEAKRKKVKNDGFEVRNATPSAKADTEYVKSLYRELLGRAPDAAVRASTAQYWGRAGLQFATGYPAFVEKTAPAANVNRRSKRSAPA